MYFYSRIIWLQDNNVSYSRLTKSVIQNLSPIFDLDKFIIESYFLDRLFLLHNYSKIIRTID